MSKKDHNDEQTERLLSQARPAGPSAQLKARVTAAARAAWDQAPAEVPWQIPVWRLAVSAAAAAIIIALGNHLGDFGWSGAPAGSPAATAQPNPELEELAEMIYGPARSQLGARRRRGLESDEATLRDRMDRLDQMLGEMESDGASRQPTRSGGRSRLLRRRSHPGLYS
jgi:hypothetical protein